MSEERIQLTCSFCGISEDVAEVLIVGPNSVCICSLCVAICTDVVTKNRIERATAKHLAAQGIEAGTGETERLDPKGESPVAESHAPGGSHD